MSNQFALQVTPDLMRQLTSGGKKPRKPSSLGKPSPPASRQSNEIMHEKPTENRQTESGGWPGRDPFLPGFLSPQIAAPVGPVGGPTSDQPDNHLQTELSPIYKALEESEKLAEKLDSKGDDELVKVKQMAQELHEKQYKAPSRPAPCVDERGACIDCYKKNHKDPLLCASVVRTFVACSRQAQEMMQ